MGEAGHYLFKSQKFIMLAAMVLMVVDILFLMDVFLVGPQKIKNHKDIKSRTIMGACLVLTGVLVIAFSGKLAVYDFKVLLFGKGECSYDGYYSRL